MLSGEKESLYLSVDPFPQLKVCLQDILGSKKISDLTVKSTHIKYRALSHSTSGKRITKSFSKKRGSKMEDNIKISVENLNLIPD